MVAQSRKNAVSQGRRSGFTLVELLVVISIIALLIAILLPSLSKARDQAKTVVCATRIKGLLAAMSVYATENKGYIAGSPNTSGSVLFGPQETDVAGMEEAWSWNPVQVWDWGGGLATSMGMKFSTKRHEARFIETAKMKAFKCPSNKILSVAPKQGLGFPDYGTLPMVSYNTSRNFMWPGKRSLLASSFPDPIGGFGVDPYWTTVGVGWNWDWRERAGVKRHGPAGWAEASKESYLPRVDEVGAPAGKVFIADGARYTIENKEPTYNASPYGAYGGAFSDVGPYSFYSRAWDRSQAWEEYRAVGLKDARIYSYRHGKKQAYLPLGNYKMNVGFFDNHVETMNDIESANPHMWLPRGFRLYLKTDDLHPDVIEKYMQVLETDGREEFLLIR